MKKFRKPSAAEYSYIGRDTDEESPFVNQFFVEGNGKINLEQMQQAVALAAEKNPGISLLLKGRWAWRYWQKNSKLPEVSEYSGNWQANDSENQGLLNTPLDVRKDVLSSIVLFTNIQSDKNNLDNDINFKVLFKIHHALCDGMGTVHWIQEIFRALRSETVLGSISTFNELDIIAREDYPQAENLLTESKGIFPISSKPDERGCHWIKCRWPANDTKIVAKLIYVLKSIAEQEHGECKTTFRIASDLRRYLSKEEKLVVQLSNLSAVFDLRFETNIDVNQIQNRIVKALRAKEDLSVYPKKLAPLTKLLPKSVFQPKEKFLKNMHQQGLCNITGMLSYLGKAKLDDYSCPGFKALGVYAIPMCLEDKSIYIGFFSDEYGINAVLSAPNALSTIQSTRHLAETIEQALSAL